jgi:predicted glycogen debranching enzyme
MIRYGLAICRNLETALRREWLETNGLGGYASSTIICLNTRRYHGLLVASTPAGRFVLLAKLEETLVIEDRQYDLAANRYPAVVHPRGYLFLKEFRQDPFPVFVYELEGIEIQKSVLLVDGENTVVIQYELHLPPHLPAPVQLQLRPLIAFRDHHATTHENPSLNPYLNVAPGGVSLTPYPGLPTLYFGHSAAQLQQSGDWYRNFEYERERERGLDFREDLYNPFTLIFDLDHDATPGLIASIAPPASHSPADLHAAEVARRQRIVESSPSLDPFGRMLSTAADQFIVHRRGRPTVMAGYPWFDDWGRDTMISLPGLTLATRRPDLARDILLAWAVYADRGMLPNRFPGAGETPEYNTVDATLWFFEAVRALLATTGDFDFVRTRLYDLLSSVITWHERGTRYGIRTDRDGLLLSGERAVQLTWMDAKIGDRVVTPRCGKPVEVQALWYHALRIMQDLALRFGLDRDASHYRDLADLARVSFQPLFWNPAADCLYDVVDRNLRDASIRPNQIFAASLFHKLLPPARAKAVVDTVHRYLWTPYGLRTLAPADPGYRPRYQGDPASRDSAYHQGTVWPWLMGPFITAFLAVHGHSAEARERARGWLAEFRRFMEQEGVGQVPEVFDGDEPHRPGGCIAQAWSIAEILRAALEVGAA